MNRKRALRWIWINRSKVCQFNDSCKVQGNVYRDYAITTVNILKYLGVGTVLIVRSIVENNAI